MKTSSAVWLAISSAALSTLITLYMCQWMIEARFDDAGRKLADVDLLEDRIAAVNKRVDEVYEKANTIDRYRREDTGAILGDLVRIKTALAVAHIQF